MKIYIGPYRKWNGLLRRLTKKERRIKIKIHKYDTWSMNHTLALIIVPMLKQLKETKHGAPNVDDEDVPENLRSTNAKPKENEHDLDEFHFDRWDYVLDEMIFAFESIVDDSWEDQFYSGKSDIGWKLINPEETDKEKQFYEMIKGPNDTYKVDNDGLKAYNNRIDNGTRLLGKYFRNLWD